MLIKKRLIFPVILSIILLNLILILAQNSTSNITKDSHDNKDELTKAFNNLQCKTDFTIGIINSMISNVPSEKLSNYTLKLQNDMSQLQTFIDNNDKDGFRDYLKDNYDKDIRQFKTDARDWRKSNRNLTKEEKETISKTYSDLKDKYDSCELDSSKLYGNGRINNFNNILAEYQKKVDALSSKGIDVTRLNQVLSDAKSEIVDPFQKKLDNANSTKEVKLIMQSFCLFDGCKTGSNFHLAAKFNIAKLEIAYDMFSKSNVSTSSLSKLDNYITTSKSALGRINTAKYSTESKKLVWDNIKLANEIIKQIKKEYKGN